MGVLRAAVGVMAVKVRTQTPQRRQMEKESQQTGGRFRGSLVRRPQGIERVDVTKLIKRAS